MSVTDMPVHGICRGSAHHDACRSIRTALLGRVQVHAPLGARRARCIVQDGIAADIVATITIGSSDCGLERVGTAAAFVKRGTSVNVFDLVHIVVQIDNLMVADCHGGEPRGGRIAVWLVHIEELSVRDRRGEGPGVDEAKPDGSDWADGAEVLLCDRSGAERCSRRLLGALV